MYFQSKGYHDHARPDVKPIRNTKASRAATAIASKNTANTASKDQMASVVKAEHSFCQAMLKRRLHCSDPSAYLTHFLPSNYSASKLPHNFPENSIRLSDCEFSMIATGFVIIQLCFLHLTHTLCFSSFVICHGSSADGTSVQIYPSNR